ncbi:6,7-dimethyl-8-ribityllumazine synthase [Albimonas donghaensis]|uniref:6,7-dimethyl-8-ribityllumazine synthase n=1 Tax=Albimonas donghaensis TaxID=356660 RepID=A0A1H2WH37_9RHOB|nr:6,7-dimethyl-8-ribityllumazine synthase [Albimonas donghaensis]SDW79816.1 6,7-dimethyl-8-ribityllumazine synthase [Albimonas donghaensis]
MDRTQTQSKTQSTGKAARVAFIRARWHSGVVDEACASFTAEMDGLTQGGAEVEVLDVPGAFEIPLLAKRLAATGRYDAVVGCAFVVDGGIYRHDFVSETVVSALMQVGLETGIPVLSVVLTPHNFQETPPLEAFFRDHFVVKGREAAEACMATLEAHRAVEGGAAALAA